MKPPARRPTPAPARRARPYSKPVLRTLGRVADLTRGVGGSNADAGQQNVTKHGIG
jgi:hypothetical protein